MPALLPRHRAHDYAALMAAWQRVAQQASLQTTVLGHAEELEVMAFESAACAPEQAPIYLSAGVHGDEVAGAWGLLQWAQANIALLKREAFTLSPCMNPKGLVLNTRADHRGQDLNRRFHITRDPLISAWQKFIKALPPRLSLCLHEDFDGQGCYVYELSHGRKVLCAPVLAQVESVLPHDPRRDIDGQQASRGIIRRTLLPPKFNGPEAIVLYKLGCPVTLTFETPSEFSLDDRIAAQRTFIDASLEHLADIPA